MKKGTAYLLGVVSAAAAGVAGRLTGAAPRGQAKILLDTQLPEAPVVMPGIPHIACIGDSITYGHGVAALREIHSWPVLLQGLLQGLQLRVRLQQGQLRARGRRERPVHTRPRAWLRLPQPQLHRRGYSALLYTSSSVTSLMEIKRSSLMGFPSESATMAITMAASRGSVL